MTHFSPGWVTIDIRCYGNPEGTFCVFNLKWYDCCVFVVLHSSVDRSLKRRQVKPLAASLLDALDYDSSDDSDFEVGDSSGKWRRLIPLRKMCVWKKKTTLVAAGLTCP